jgi:hypothetical protein
MLYILNNESKTKAKNCIICTSTINKTYWIKRLLLIWPGIEIIYNHTASVAPQSRNSRDFSI